MKEKFHINSLFFKILCTVVVGIICVSFAVSGTVINISKDIFIDTFGRSQEKVFERIEENLYNFHINLCQISNTVDSSWAFQAHFNRDDLSPATSFQTIYQMKKHLKDGIPTSIEDVSVLVVGLDGQSYLNSNEKLTTSTADILEDEVSKNALESPGTILYQYAERGFTATTKSQPVIMTTRVLSYVETGKPYGIIYITIKEKDFRKFYDYFISETNDIFVLDYKNRVASSNQNKYLGLEQDELDEFSDSFLEDENVLGNMKKNGRSVFVLSHRLPYYNFKLFGVIDTSKALSEMYDMPKLIALCSFITLVVLVIIFIMIQQTTKPLSLLAKKMSKVRDGKFDQYVAVTGTDEVRELSTTFNYMLDDLNQYVVKLLEVQKEKRTAEIHALQMQINPHYIFNTLTSIKWLIWQGDTGKSTQMIDAFILLLRNTISNTNEFITIGQEMENLKNYVFINNARYGENVTVEYFVPFECEKYLLPKLILQPFIENSFFHAFTGDRKGEIQVFIREQGDKIRFEITDNGVGMDEEQVSNLRQKKKMKNEHFTGIGINNVDDRIKLIYGLDYGITITSEIDRGTTVVILLPKREV